MKYFYKFSLFAAFMLVYISMNAQDWTKNSKSKNPTFFEVKAAFTEYYKNKKVVKNEEEDYFLYKRWEWFWESRVDNNGNFPKSSIVYDEWKKYVESHSSVFARTASSSGNWTAIGPYQSSSARLGRVNCVAFDPVDTNIIWAGTPAGGLWKSTDRGNTWLTNTDNLPVLGVSDIAIDPTNSNNMYIATGDGDNSYSTSTFGNPSGADTKSIGVLKSTNGGATWVQTGLNWTVISQMQIRRIIMDPSNTSNLLAASSGGIYKSTDGGNTWNNQTSGWFMDIVYHPGNSQIVYAASFSPYGNGSAQVYVSNDGGTNWSVANNFYHAGRISLAVTAAAPNMLVAFACNGSNDALNGVYKSSNSGATFTNIFGNTTINILGSNIDGSDLTYGQGKYDLCFAVSQIDSTLMYAGGVNTWRSTDGGTTWNINTMWWAQDTLTAPLVHADKHWMCFHPLLPNKLYQGNDGGVYVSNDVTVNSGKIWKYIANTMQIGEVYRISTSQTSPSLMLAGLQDNGCKKARGTNWTTATGGDGMGVLIDYSDTTYMYASYVNGVLYRNTDGFNSQNKTTISNNIPGTPTGSWLTPYVLNPINPKTLYAGLDQVYKTTDRGNSWTSLSTSLPGSGNTFNWLAIAPSDSMTLYAGTLNGLWVTTNEGGTWTDIYANVNAVASNAVISYISVHPANSHIIYISLQGYNTGNKVVMSTDGGNTFTNISGTLPNVGANCVAVQKNSPNSLYLGTETGVFYRDSTMTDWIPFSTNLPNVNVTHLEIQYIANRIVAATFGRGVWASDLYSPSNGIKQLSNQNNSFTINPNPINRTFTLTIKDFSGTDKAYIYNYLGQTMKEVSVSSSTQVIDMSELPSGIYYVAVKSNNFRNLFKLVKVN